MTDDAHDDTVRTANPSWWKQRTKIERWGFISMAVTILIIIGLIIALALVLSHQSDQEAPSRSRRSSLSNEECNRRVLQSSANTSESSSVCVTRGCVHAAETVLQFIDEAVNPCDDFYQFACGRFLEETTIPADKTEVSPVTILNDLVQKQLKQILEETPKHREPKPFSFLRQLYNACMDTSAIEAYNLTPVKFLLRDIGGWAVLEGSSWDEEKFDWKVLLYRLRYYGLTTNKFLNFKIIPDPKNSSRHVILLDQVEVFEGRENLLQGFDNAVVRTYYDYMVDLAVIFGADRHFAEGEVKEMVEFKIDLANITNSESPKENYSALYNLITVRELQRNYSTIDWVDLINGIISLPIKQVSNDDKIIVSQPQYFRDLEKLLKQSSRRVLANYMIFQAITELAWFLPERIRNRHHRYQTAGYGTTAQHERWTECVIIASGWLPVAAGSLYVRKYANKHIRQQTMKMVEDIQSEFIKVLEHIDWMDDATRKRAITKASAMVSRIAYADEFLDNKKIKEHYTGLNRLTFLGHNYFRIRNHLSKFRTDKEFGKLWKPVSKNDWSGGIPLTMINAFSNPSENSIQIPLAILQGIFFDKDRPHYMNYAAIGSAIGHEITHGFDDEGKQYDENGNLVNWWAEDTHRAFMDKAKCMVDQYEKYTVPETGVKLQGVKSQGENIADNGGLKQAYLAYSAWVKRHGAEPTLPGLNYTTRQMFWISAANVWCTKERNESLATNVLADNHSPERFRVLVPFSNLEYFAEDFNCPVGSNMNPKHKCKIW